MIFPLKRSNALTDFMMTPYIDSELGVHDPDELGAWTPEDFVKHVKALRNTLPEADFDQLLPILEEQYRRILSAPRRPGEEIVVPSRSCTSTRCPANIPTSRISSCGTARRRLEGPRRGPQARAGEPALRRAPACRRARRPRHRQADPHRRQRLGARATRGVTHDSADNQTARHRAAGNRQARHCARAASPGAAGPAPVDDAGLRHLGVRARDRPDAVPQRPAAAPLHARGRPRWQPGDALAAEWEEGAFDITLLSSYGERLWYRVLQGGDEFAEDTSKREAAEERAREANRAHNNMFVPALGMTGGQALSTLKPGLHVAAMPYGIVPVPPLVPKQGMEGLAGRRLDQVVCGAGGWFAWKGAERLELYILGNDNPQFWKEVVYYVLHEGDSLKPGCRQVLQAVDEINRTMLAAFAIALTSAPSLGRRADLTEAAFAPTISNTERGLARQTEKELGGSVLKKIDPVEAVHVGLAVAAKPWEGLKGLLSPGDDELEAEMAQLTDAALAELRRRVDAEGSKNYDRDLRTGELGEASFKLTLKLKGYSVVELQNASGHGVDLVAIKVKGGVGWIYFFEVKSSEKDYPGPFCSAVRSITLQSVSPERGAVTTGTNRAWIVLFGALDFEEIDPPDAALDLDRDEVDAVAAGVLKLDDRVALQLQRQLETGLAQFAGA